VYVAIVILLGTVIDSSSILLIGLLTPPFTLIMVGVLHLRMAFPQLSLVLLR
jgi:hypothetical protein